ncbi:hypothetical protein F4861DRAFT_406168 [Xylaria intraflava]|nr:hypothetical protein F4861DRAFT_406168 [Xylaria intraflava]
MPPPSLPRTAARVITRSRTLRTPQQTKRPLSSKPKAKPAPKPLPYQPAQPKPPPPPPKQRKRSDKAPMSQLVRERWMGMLGFGGAVLCLGYFTASTALYWRREPATRYAVGQEPAAPSGRPSIQSPYEFDLHLDKQEWRLGITRLRRELSAQARGHVLEVVVGTGRNFEFYDWGAITDSLAPAGGSSSWIPGWGGKKEEKEKEKEKEKGAREDAVLSFTGVDISPGMLDIALKRIRQVVPHMTDQVPKRASFAMLAAKNNANANTNTNQDPKNTSKAQPQSHVVSFLEDQIRIFQSDVQTALPAPPTLPGTPTTTTTTPQPEKYDTILQTFGLCSVRDPVSLLSQMATAIKPNTGRILLLEHGRSVWDVVNGFLDRGARGHHERFGCWWNRDIEDIVAAAAARVPGLEVVRLARPGWTTAGTHVVVELRVHDAGADGADPRPEKRKPAGWAAILPSLFPSDNGGKS